ncbi:MAG: sensor histidine kinase [Enterococcus lemanii]|jgi:two-component system sensor histidine kinase YesM
MFSYSFKRLSKFSIRQQLFIIYIPLVFLSTIAIGLTLVFDSTKQLTQNYQHLAALNTQRVKSTLFNTTNTLYTIAATLSNDTRLREILSTNYENEQLAINDMNHYQQIEEIIKLQPAIAELTIYTTNHSLPNYKYLKKIEASERQTNWFRQAQKQSNEFWITLPEDAKANRLSLFKVLPLPLSLEQAILEIRLDYNYLSNQLSTPSYYVELQLNNDPLFYSDDIKQVGTSLDALTQSLKFPSESFQTKQNQRQLIATNSLKMRNKNDQIYIFSIDSKAHVNLRSNIYRWSAIVLSILLTTLFIVILFAKFFTDRIHELQEAVYHASIENYDYLYNISGKDEVSKISVDFHKVISRIKQKELEIYQAQLFEQELLNQQQQMEYNLLASQINPHFLFNTLETIRMTAIKSGNTDVAFAIKLLAKSMRYTLEVHGTKLTTLKRELDSIHVYIRIQRLRFGDRVNFSSKISNDIDLERTFILPLLIQPLVENAISHGLENITTNDGEIHLIITKEGTNLIITVQDNGVGIPIEDLQSLRQKINLSSSQSQKNIGLANVNHRAKMFYGDNYGITIHSKPKVGTQIILVIKTEE